MGIEDIVAVLIAVVFIGLAITSYYSEKKTWNNGACRCGRGFWKSFDMDSSGAVGYRCTNDDCGKYIWISWDRITR